MGCWLKDTVPVLYWQPGVSNPHNSVIGGFILSVQMYSTELQYGCKNKRLKRKKRRCTAN